MSQILLFGITMITAGVASAAIVPLAKRLGWRLQALDHPNYRKHHNGSIPRTGGLAIATGILAGLLMAFVLGLFSSGDGSLWKGAVFIVAGALIFAVGFLDDFRSCSVGVKLAVQVVAAVMVVATGHTVDRVFLPVGESLALDSEFLAAVVAVVWLVGITNAINFMDGLDGLAGGLAVIIAICMGMFAIIQGVPSVAAVSVAICGSCLGFLPFNWHPARIFLGDGGSLLIGFVLGCLSLTASLKSSTTVAVLIPLLVVGVPAADALFVMLARFRERTHGRRFLQRVVRVFQADRLHLHHYGLALIRHHQAVVLLLYAIVACFCISALIVTIKNNPTLAAVILVVEIAAVAMIRFAGSHASKQNGEGTRV